MLSKIRTTPPRVQTELISRTELLGPDKAITVLAAPAGYGKSQLLAQWCSETGENRRIAYGVCSRLGETASSLLELLYAALAISARFQARAPWQEQADVLLEFLYGAGLTTIILDEVHHLESETSQAEECSLLLSYLLDYRAPDCQWIFSGRSKPTLADLELKEMTGEARSLTAKALSLKPDQLECLAPGLGQRLLELTSGWPLACAVLLKTSPAQWETQRDKLSQSLLTVATQGLDEKSSDALAVLGLVGSASRQELEKPELWQLLEPLINDGALVQRLDEDRICVHPLFAEQYREVANESQRQRAIDLLSQSERGWEALELVSDSAELSRLLIKHGSKLLSSGRFRLLEKLLPSARWEPQVAILQGRLRWYQGDPAGAMECFTQSAQVAGAQGQTLVAYESWKAAGQLYIDAVYPAEALHYLKKAYRVLGPGERAEKAEVLEMLAENAVNVGQARLAHRYRSLARRWVSQKQEDLALTARLLLRSGRLSEARGAAQVARKSNSRKSSLDGHRDPRLVLSYLACLEGLSDLAASLALEVLEEAQEKEDIRSQSVALTRLAHAHLLQEKSQQGLEPKTLTIYSQADSLAKTLGIERLRAEALMGLALYHVHHGNTPRAYEACREGVGIAEKSGDEWLSSWLRFVRAVAAVEGGHPSGLDLLKSSKTDFRNCRDRFGYALAEIWQAVSTEEGGPGKSLKKHLEEFPFLRQRDSLFAPPFQRVAALSQNEGPRSNAPHRLQVFCLGPLSLLRDGEAVPAKAFKRKKARELFVLLLASPDTYFHREELAAQLWPEASQKAALRDFRVALHALSDALEPERAKNTTAFCIDRQEERYRLESHKLDLDINKFELLLEEPSPESWEKAVRLYRGPFCEDYPYLEILEPIRQRFDHLYLRLAEKLASFYLQSNNASAATELAQKMLSKDQTWEPAYRLLMRSQHSLGHEHLLPRTFTRCLETLEEELGVEPSEETFELARELLGDQLTSLL